MRLHETDGLSVPEPVAVRVIVPLVVTVAVEDRLPEWLTVMVTEAVELWLMEPEDDPDRLAEPDTLLVTDGEPDSVRLTDTERLTVAVPLGVRVRAPLVVTVAELDSEPLREYVPVPEEVMLPE